MGGRPRFGWVRRGELRGIEADSAVWWLGCVGGWDLDGSGGEGGVSILGVVEMIADAWFRGAVGRVSNCKTFYRLAVSRATKHWELETMRDRQNLKNLHVLPGVCFMEFKRAH